MDGTEKTRLRRRLLGAAEYAFAFTLIYALFEFDLVRPDELLRAVEKPFPLALAFLLALAGIPLAAWRWQILLRFIGFDLAYRRVFQISYIGVFFNAFLPGGVGGDAMRSLMLFRELSSGRVAATLSLLADRIIGLLGLLVLALLVLPVRLDLILERPAFGGIALTASGLLASALFVLLLALHLSGREGMRRRLARLLGARAGGLAIAVLDAAAAYRRFPIARLAACLGLSLAVHALSVAAIVVIAGSLSIGVLGPADYLIVAPLSVFVNALPVTPGGLGVGEAAFGQLAALLEEAPTGAAYATAFLIYRGIAIAAGLPGVVAYLIYRRPR
jgi:uncharacterized membrane protein YbhN (UPF0104 family)